jgi:hypothetical protein
MQHLLSQSYNAGQCNLAYYQIQCIVKNTISHIVRSVDTVHCSALVEKASGVCIKNSKLMLHQSQKFNTSAQSVAIVAQRLAPQ